MANKDNHIIFQTDDGDEIEFAVMEQTTIGGINYLLVTETDGDEEAFLIMKEDKTGETSGSDEMASFDILEDEKELKLVAQVFNELLEDVDLEV